MYWLLDQLPGVDADMGVAVVIFTLIIRVLMLPLTLSGMRGEKERRDIENKIKVIEEEYSHDPIEKRRRIKKTMRTNRFVIIGELFSLFIQVIIAIMLWRIFARGLPGADIHLIYDFMPEVGTSFNLMFLGKYDLSHPHWQMNLIQSFVIFLLESLRLYVSPFPVSREEVIRLQVILPIVSFMIFSQLPAGKKLFVITTLLFSLCVVFVRAVIKKVYDLQEKLAIKDKAEESKEEKVVVDVG